MRTFQTLSELAACTDTLTSAWVPVTQAMIDRFAEATGDHQWIHVDVERARRGPFGAPIAHGFLTLSLLPRFFDETLRVVEAGMGVNYGLNRVRFMAPVPVDSRLRARMRLLRSDEVGNGGRQFTWEVTVEREGVDKPVCVAESLARHYP